MKSVSALVKVGKTRRFLVEKKTCLLLWSLPYRGYACSSTAPIPQHQAVTVIETWKPLATCFQSVILALAISEFLYV